MQPMKHLDYGQAVVFLEKAVAEKGANYVYESIETEEAYGEYDEMRDVQTACLYFHDGQPSCIVGHVLSYMGYTEATEGQSATQAIHNLGIEADARTQALLSEVQEAQDQGVAWGRAVGEAQFGD